MLSLSPRHEARFASPVTYLVMGLAMLRIDVATGPFLQFPITFVIAVLLAGWYAGAPTAYAAAILLPLGRLGIAVFVESRDPIVYALANASVRILVLLVIARLALASARRSRQLHARVDELVRVCAWNRTIEYEGEWLSFESYLKRRFGLDTTHGISPEAAARMDAQIRRRARPGGTGVDAAPDSTAGDDPPRRGESGRNAESA